MFKELTEVKAQLMIEQRNKIQYETLQREHVYSAKELMDLKLDNERLQQKIKNMQLGT